MIASKQFKSDGESRGGHFKWTMAPVLWLVSLAAACTTSTQKPSITVRATKNGVTTSICIKGSGFTPSGPIRSSVLMPDYTVNGQPGPNPIATAPFGNSTAQSSGGVQQTAVLGPVDAVCAMVLVQGQPVLSQPLLTVLDQTTLVPAVAALPPAFLCASEIPPPPAPPVTVPLPPPAPFGDPSACQ